MLSKGGWSDAAAIRKKAITGPAPRVILCVGLKSSGSTWLYNVVIQLLKEKYARAA